MNRSIFFLIATGFAACSETGASTNWLLADVSTTDVSFVAHDVAADTALDGKSADGATDGKGADSGTPGADTGNTAKIALFINEVACEENPDWFELFNPDADPVDLTGWTFADVLGDATKRVPFPANSVVPGNGFLVIEVTTEANGFKLGANEELGVYRPDGSKADSVNWNTGDCAQGTSFSRIPDGTGSFVNTKKQTPDKPNKP